jgi:hypothetical protein
LKKGKYISEDERGGFKVAKVNFPLSDGRLRLFLGERRLVRGRTSCADKEKVLPWPKEEVRNKIMCHHL